MFHCQRRSLDLSVEACIIDFQRVQRRGTFPWRSDWHCRHCSEGAEHAHCTIEEIKALVVEPVLKMCTRCHRPADRLIKNRLCRSCDARDRELLKGRNGKGSFPRLLAARLNLHPVALWVRTGARLEKTIIDRASGLLEAIMTLARREGGPLELSRGVESIHTRQLSFWGGC